MKPLVPVLLVLLAACASTQQQLPGRYAVVVDRELAASRWEVEQLVDDLREQLGHVDLVGVPSAAEYDAVIELDLKHARGISTIGYEIFAGERTRTGRVLVGRTTSAILYREYPPDRAWEVMRTGYMPGARRFIGWEKVPPAGQVRRLAGMIVRDLERMR